MLSLRTLGGISLEDSTGAAVGFPRRKHSVALLALLAGATRDGMSRDRLIALLWPETDEARGRNNLKQIIFALRRALGQDVLLNGTASLQLNPEVITADIWTFAEAAKGDLHRAASLYRGPFLDGFFLGGSATFEHWVTETRDRLAGQYRELLEKLAV